MFKSKKMNKAFTLIEMMIVVIIIGILMGALLPKLKGAQERARDTARKANLSTVSTALQMYYNDNGNYPT
jgi:general secretion pathway protein G